MPISQISVSERISILIEKLGENQNSFSKKTGIAVSTIATAIERGKGVNTDLIQKIINAFTNVSSLWLLTGEGEIFIDDLKEEKVKSIESKKINIETRPRIPFNAAAGTVSIALSGVTPEDSEQMPVIQAFANYSYTILVKGDSMEPEFHSGDELACLQLTNGKAKFIQWGRYHVLDTAQGVLVKRIYDNGEYILCKSENSELYPDFNIHKEDIYNLGLVIGMLRRF